MTGVTDRTETNAVRTLRPTWSAADGSPTCEDGIAARLATLLAPVVQGPLPVHLTAWDGSTAGPADAPHVRVTSANALRRLLWHPGELGAAQAYVTGELDVDGDLDQTLRHIWRVARERGLRSLRPRLAEVAALLREAPGMGALGLPPQPPATQARTRGRLHSRRRDRQAISHHYDFSNDFYELLLDPHLSYSCAYWTSNDPAYGLVDAQTDKLDLVCRKLGLRPGMQLLDVGCGWGSLSLSAAAHCGVEVTGVTIAAEQQRFIRARTAERGLGHWVQIRLQDYREVVGEPYDAVGSLEMGEHIGQGHYPAYVEALRRNVKPGGRVLIQRMSRPGKHPGGGAFIESFIAPDMTMRPLGETVALVEAGGVEVRDVHALREHYVRTVAVWRHAFESNWDRVVALVGEQSARVWRLYVVGGSLAFEQVRWESTRSWPSGRPTMAGRRRAVGDRPPGPDREPGHTLGGHRRKARRVDMMERSHRGRHPTRVAVPFLSERSTLWAPRVTRSWSSARGSGGCSPPRR